ncbi:MAG: pseudouridine synthase [Flavobacteriales bacterium]
MTDRTDRSKKGGKKGPTRGARPSNEPERPRSSRAGKRPPAAERDGHQGARRTGASGGPRTRSARPDGEGERSSTRGTGRSGGPSRQAFGRAGRPGNDERRSAGPGAHGTSRSAPRGSGERPNSGRTQRSEGRPTRDEQRGERSTGRSGPRPTGGRWSDRPARGEGREEGSERTSRSGDPRPPGRSGKSFGARPDSKGPARNKRSKRAGEEGPPTGLIRLNRYLSQSGVASRREADELIKAGVVTVNGVVVTELGTKVYPSDKVHYGGQRLSMEKPRYVLLNKPKGFITTTDDPNDRRTVMQLVAAACTERIYPVGRLDRLTTGLLLLTNDGDLAKKLTHPSHGAEKIYHATLDKTVTKAHLQQLVEGVELEDGMAKADEAAYVDGASRKEVGLKLHMGRNRIVRRMFEALGYEVLKLDRVVFAGLTKKDIPRGRWRMLTDKEVVLLKQRK